MDGVKESFTLLEPAFLIKETTFEDLPENNRLLAYIPIIVIEQLSVDYFKIQTLQDDHEYLCHKDVLIKVKNMGEIFVK